MLKNLTIDGLRGATKRFDLPFDPTKRITIIYGENGCGKSTICDALEFVTERKVSSLENRGLGQTARYWVSTGREGPDVKVKLDTMQGTWEAGFAGRNVVVSPDSGQPRMAMLRRRQILELVCANPSSRFEVIRPFIDIDAIEAAEKSLGDLIRSEKRSRESAVARVEENGAAIERFWKEAGEPEPDALTWAKLESDKDLSDLDEEIDLLTKVDKTIDSIDATGDRWVALGKELKDGQKAEKEATDNLTQAKGKVKDGSADVVEILQSAAEVLHDHDDPSACPLCESKENVKGLVKRIDERLATISALTNALSAHKKAKRSLERVTESEKEERERLKSLIHKFCKSLLARDAWPKDVTPSKELHLAAKPVAKLDNATELAEESLVVLMNLIIAFGDLVSAGIERRQGQKAVHTQLKQAVKVYEENLEAQLRLDVLIPRYEDVLVAVMDERRAFVDSILEGIAERVGELYEMVHPEEGLSKIELQLDPKKRSSLEIGATFPGVDDAPPQAFFSDSHLDTLGLCMFLALAELDDPENKIVVLDDVLGSVDEPHVDRVVNMLYDVADGFQHFILTTHYKPWRELFRWGHLRNGECNFIELVHWSHTRGLQHTKAIPQVEQLRALLNGSDPDPQDVCAKAGVILEAVLDFLTLLYRCRVPRQDGNYTLGDLLGALNSKLKTAMRVEKMQVAHDGTVTYDTITIGPIIEELLKKANARNVIGCHFNELARHLNDRAGLQFGQLVLDLADAIVDQEHGWPKLDRSGSYWSNKKETRKLHPLKQPA